MGKNRSRELWIDNVKGIACTLVVVGHFVQSMIKSNVYEEYGVFLWFLKTIYYFHVPLFFICSGYLYQKTICLNSISDWRKNIKRKMISIGIPFFTFSMLTWFLKTIFSGDVNEQVAPLWDVLFFHPVSPYWYLYTLLFLFIFIPVLKKGKKIMLDFAILMKLMIIFMGDTKIYLLNSIAQNLIWFVIGLYLEFYNVPGHYKNIQSKNKGVFAGIVFLIASIPAYIIDVKNFISFCMGILACYAMIVLVINSVGQRKIQTILNKYTWEIFLMHTLFAATMRSILFKVGISNWAIHTIAGLGISFLGPIVFSKIAVHFKGVDMLLNPQRYLGIEVNEEGRKVS